MRSGADDAAEDTFAELMNGLALSGGAGSGRRRRTDASQPDTSMPTEPMSAPPWHEPAGQPPTPADHQWPQVGHDSADGQPGDVYPAEMYPAEMYPAEMYPAGMYPPEMYPVNGHNGYADAYAGHQDRADQPADRFGGFDGFDDGFDEESDAAIVRPYAWTGGRTRSSGHFQMETLVSTTGHGEDEANVAAAEHRSIAELCHEPRSVAEVSALLDVPIGVAKVLLSDMAELGLVIVHRTAIGGGNRSHLKLMERVLGGLRRL